MALARLRGGDRLERELKKLAAKVQRARAVRIGFLQGSTYPDGTPVALVAAANEFGTANTPPRPFFRGMIADESDGWAKAIKDQLIEHDFDAKAALDVVGEGIKGQLQQAIADYVGTPLSPKTIARKGFDKQLVDTGHMMNSVEKEVV